MTLMNKHLATVGKKLLLNRKDSWNQAQGGAAICHDRSGRGRGGRQDKRCSVEEKPEINNNINIINNHGMCPAA